MAVTVIDMDKPALPSTRDLAHDLGWRTLKDLYDLGFTITTLAAYGPGEHKIAVMCTGEVFVSDSQAR
jgi:hypothetical protein